MTSAFSWQNSISFCPASFCTQSANLPVTPCISWLPTFTFQSPMMRSSLVAQRLKHLPAMRKTWVQSRGQADILEKDMAIHSSILAWRIPWRDEPGGLQSTGSQRVGHDWENNTFTFKGTEKRDLGVVAMPVVPNLVGTKDRFRGRQFFHRQRGGWFQDDSSALHLLGNLFLLLLHQLHLTSAGTRFRDWGPLGDFLWNKHTKGRGSEVTRFLLPRRLSRSDVTTFTAEPWNPGYTFL